MSVEVQDHLQVVVIEQLTDDLKEHIREYLVAVCRGSVAAEDDPTWDYISTIRELDTRIKAKDRNSRVGMVGELLTHVLAPALLPHLSQTAVYFNKEERSVKKGFDLTFLEEDAARVWYAEVKSGEPSSDEHPARKAVRLLKTAATDLMEKLTSEDRASIWDSAKYDAMATLHNPSLKTAKQLLSKDLKSASHGEDWDRHAILTAGLFSAVDTLRIDVASLISKLGETKKFNNGFREEVWLVLQKSTFTAVVDFVAAEATP